MSDVIISGYYGLGNSGDEALLKSIIDDLRSVDPDITITALSGNAQLTKKLYGIKTVSRMNIFSIIKEFCSAKLLISGGGTLIQDATSTKSLLYYLGIIYLAKKMGLKVMMYANGMGPIKKKNFKRVKKVLDKVDLITLRENESLKEIDRCNIKGPEIKVTADPAFNLVASERECAEKILAKYNIKPDERLVAVSVRKCKNLPESFTEEIALSLDRLVKKGYTPIFIPMQKSQDLELSLDVASKMKEHSRIVDCDINVPDMLSLIGKCEMVCGMRLHMLIFASVMDVPMAGIAYDPKIKGFMKYMNQNAFVEIENFNAEKFSALLENCIENLESMKEKLTKDSELLRKKAGENARLAVELLKK